jgi:hypothetical protein
MVEAATHSDFCGYHLSERKAGRLMVGPLWPRTIAIAVFEVAGVVRPRAGGYGNIEPVVCNAAHIAERPYFHRLLGCSLAGYFLTLLARL